MTWLKELYGLFVEDGTLALAILIWIAVAAFLFPSGRSWCAPAFFIGLVVLLLENVRRATSQKR